MGTRSTHLESDTDPNSTQRRALPDVLTVAEGAQQLRVSSRHLANLIASGAVPSFKIGRCRRLLRSTVEKIMVAGGSS